MVSDFLIVTGLGIGLSIFTILVNKLLINEKFVDKSKADMKKMQSELKGLDVKSKEFKEKQNKIMSINFDLMKQQFKPMMVTFLPYIIIFYLIGNMFAFAPIAVGSLVHFDVIGNTHLESKCLDLNKTIEKSESFDATVNSVNCTVLVNGKATDNIVGKQDIINFNANNSAVKITPPKEVFINLPFNLPFIGNTLGWLGTFILFSFVTSTIFNRLLKGIYLRKWE